MTDGYPIPGSPERRQLTARTTAVVPAAAATTTTTTNGARHRGDRRSRQFRGADGP
jgi:hypothetical protein